MSNAYSRRAFFATAILVVDNHPLVALYSFLIHLELTLKDYEPALRSLGHNLPLMLGQLGADASLKEQLETHLTALWSVGQCGTPKSIPAKSYPHIRYLRHASDHPEGDDKVSHDAQVQDLINLIRQQIVPDLRTLGVPL